MTKKVINMIYRKDRFGNYNFYVSLKNSSWCGENKT